MPHLVSLAEYLDTAYSPDREYVDGVVVERHLGEGPTYSRGCLEQVTGDTLTTGEIRMPLEDVFRGL